MLHEWTDAREYVVAVRDLLRDHPTTVDEVAIVTTTAQLVHELHQRHLPTTLALIDHDMTLHIADVHDLTWMLVAEPGQPGWPLLVKR